MEPVNIIETDDRAVLRRWLAENHATQRECWVTCNRGKSNGKGGMRYLDTVEEALCFGWIDTTVKVVGERTLQRLTPRRKNSGWTELNKERVRRLERMGAMTDAGRAVLPDMSPEAFTIDGEILAALHADDDMWRNFDSFPPLYRRVRIDNIQRKKNNRALFDKRLAKFLDATRRGEMYGDWNDGGKLCPPLIPPPLG